MNKSKYSVLVPPVYTGVVFLFCWTYLMFYATSAGIEAAAPISLYSAGYSSSALCMVATLMVIAFGFRHRVAFLTSLPVKIAAGIGLPVGTILLVLGGQVSSALLILAGGIVTGLFSGIMILQWIVAYDRVGLQVAASSFPMLMAMSVGICATLMYLPRTAMTVATIAFPVISELMFHEVRKQPWPQFEEEAADVRDRPINFVLMLLPFAVFALSSGFLDFSSSNNNYTFAFYALVAFIPVAVSGVYLFIVARASFVGAFLVPASFLIAVCVPFLATDSLVPFSPFISIGELGAEVLLFVVPIGFAEFFSVDSLKTYALGRMIYVLFNAVGWYLAQFANGFFGQFMHSQVSIVIILVGVEVLAVCLIVAIVKANKAASNDVATTQDDGRRLDSVIGGSEEAPAVNAGFEAALAPSETGDGADNPGSNETVVEAERGPAKSEMSMTVVEKSDMGKDEDIESIEDEICAEYNLSQRERDVFKLLARGYTSSRIQKELYIAAGTVNYHSRNIYAKLGVHSKQELIDLVERAR